MLRANGFSPVFTKLASQLTAEKLTDLAIIPVIFLVMTCVSYLCSSLVSRLFRFRKRQSNFVIAMGVRIDMMLVSIITDKGAPRCLETRTRSLFPSSSRYRKL